MIGLFCLKNNSGVKLGTKKLNKLHNALTHRSHTYKTRNKIQTNLTKWKKHNNKNGKNKWNTDQNVLYVHLAN